jgi:UDP-3-O-[3-hydroxymyristoyl] glucosamine N-acyltransferase
MFLSALKRIGPLTIVKDAAFENLGFVSDSQPRMLTFLENVRHEGLIRSLKGVACVITRKELVKSLGPVRGIAVADDPRLAFFKVHNYLAKTSFYWTDFPTTIAKTARVHPRAWIAEKNVRIGARAIIEPNAVISERCIVGQRVHIMAGAVLGSVGLQVSRFPSGVVDMAHAGGIRIGDDAQVMSNAVIAPAVFRQSTTIAQGSRIGNVAFISHNVRLGARCFVGHGSVINGNVKVGRDAWIGPGVVLCNNIVIGPRAFIALGSTVIKDVAAGRRMMGSFAAEIPSRQS